MAESEPSEGQLFARRLRCPAAQILQPRTELARRLLVDRLVNLPDHAAFLRRNAHGPPRSTKLRSLNAIEKAATRLLGTLSSAEHQAPAAQAYSPVMALMLSEHARALSPRHPEAAIVDGRAGRQMREHARVTAFTAQAAGQAAKELSAQTAVGRGGPRHEADRAISLVIEYLIVAYRMVTGEQPTAWASAYAEGGADSRFIQFAKLCLDGLGWRMTTGAIRDRYRRPEQDRRAQLRLSGSASGSHRTLPRGRRVQ